MKLLSIALFLVSVYILGSCSESKMSSSDFLPPRGAESGLAYQPMTSGLKPGEITDLLYLGPVSNVYLIKNSNAMIFNDTLSNNSEQLLNKIVSDFKTNISLSGKAEVNDGATKLLLKKEIEHLFKTALALNGISNIRITPLIDSLLKSNNKRFGLIAVAEGYTRTWDNVESRKEMEKAGNVFLFILSRGRHIGVYPNVTKASSTLYMMIVDADMNNIAFFRKSVKRGEPDDETVLSDQFRKIFAGIYF
jgi:hypothetical protein